ncbi:alpha-L-fucosidase [Bacteroides sp.]
MKKIFLLLIGIFCATSVLVAQVLSPSDKPNRSQKLLQKRGYGMFIHFGVNTFSDDEWSDGSIPASTYNPTELNCDQWVRVVRDAGFRYVLLITKHHDGFCLWDSKYTDYDVASSPVKTDVVGEVSKACKKYGLDFGIYYSLWDRHEPAYKDKDFGRYIQYMKNQLTELLTNYGPVCELWFDGGWDKDGKEWRIPEIYDFVKKLQPDCAVGVNNAIVDKEDSRNFIMPDDMTVDNRYFMLYFPTDFRLRDPKIAHKKDKKQYLYKGQSYYLPFEHTICLSDSWNWFQKANQKPVRELDELEELFYWCTDNDNTLVLNVPPDNTGRIREYEANTVIELGKRLGIRKNKPFPKNGKCISLDAKAEATSVYENKMDEYGPQRAVDGGMQTRWASSEILPELVVNLNPSERLNKISIFEYCDTKTSDDGISNIRCNRIQSYQIDIWEQDKWVTVYLSDKLMGDCKIIRFPHDYQTSKIRLKVLKATDFPSIYEFNVLAMPDRK